MFINFCTSHDLWSNVNIENKVSSHFCLIILTIIWRSSLREWLMRLIRMKSLQDDGLFFSSLREWLMRLISMKSLQDDGLVFVRNHICGIIAVS